MATRRERVFYELTATDGASRVFRQVETSARGLQGAYSQLTGAVGALASAGFIAGAVRAALAAEQAQNRLSAVIKATGGAAGIARGEYDQMAESLAELTQFNDESLRAGQATLLKFGNIHGEVFRNALRLSADLAAFMGTDVPSAAQTMGKALQSPTEGLGLMERQFGKLTETEEKHIKTLVEQGRAWEAQKAVLDLFEKKVGGTAQTMNTGLSKALNEVSKQWNELLETLGKEGAVFNRALHGAAALLKDIRLELEGVRTPLRDLWTDTLDWLSLLRFVPGAIGKMGRAAQEARAAASMAARTSTGRINYGGHEEEAGLAAATTITLGGGTSEADAAATRARELRSRLTAEFAKSMAAEAQELQDYADELIYTWDTAGNRVALMQAKFKEMQEAGKRAIESWVESAEVATDLAEDMIYTWDAAGNRIEITREAFEELENATKAAKETALELGWAFSSAFEDAIIEGGKLRDVLQGLAKDVARIVLRQQVTQPLAIGLASAFSGMFSGGGATLAGPAVLGGPGYAEGTDFVPRTGWAMLHRGERVTPAAENMARDWGGGEVTVNISMPFSANTPAAVRDAVMASAPMMVEAAKRGVLEARARGVG